MSNAAIAESNAAIAEEIIPRCQCLECIDIRSLAIALPPRKTLKRGNENHNDTGTWIHWGERDPDNPHWSILITCHKCGHDRFHPKSSFKSPSWHGLCTVCVKIYNPKEGWRKFTGLETNPFGAEIDWDDNPPGDPDRRNIKCSKCHKRKKYHKISTNNKDTQPFFCDICGPEARSERIKAAYDAARAVQQPGNGQKSEVAEKRSVGRPLKSTTTNPKQTVADIQRKVLELKASSMLRSDVTANYVANELHIGGVTGGNTMMIRVNKGIKIQWAELRDFIWDGGDIEQLKFNSGN
jgi:hypothetical protein